MSKRKNPGYEVNLSSLHKKIFGDDAQQRRAHQREKMRRDGHDMVGLVPPYMYDKNSLKVMEHMVGEKNASDMLHLISGVRNGLVVNTCPIGMNEYVDFVTGRKQCTWEDNPKGKLASYLANDKVVRSGTLRDCTADEEELILPNGLRICLNKKSLISIPPTITDPDEIGRIVASAEKVKRIFHEIELDKRKAKKINGLINSAPTLKQMRSVILNHDDDPEITYLRKFTGALSSDIDIHNAQNMLYEIATQMPGYFAEPNPSTTDYLKFFGVKIIGGSSGGKKHHKKSIGGKKRHVGGKKRAVKKSAPHKKKPGKKTPVKKSVDKKKDKITSVNISDKTFIVTDDIDDVTDLLID